MPAAISASLANSCRFCCASVIGRSSPHEPVLGDDAEEESEGDGGEHEGGFGVPAHFNTGGVSNVWYGAGVGMCVQSIESAPSHCFCAAGAPLFRVLKRL